MLVRLSTTAAAVAAGILLMGSPAFAVTPVTDCHGLAVSDATGDQYILVPATGLVVKPTVAIDITGAFLEGSAGSETLNIRVADLTSSPNTVYTFRWDDNAQFGAWWELRAGFLTGSGAAGAGTYTLTHSNGSSSTIWGTTGRTFTGANGVIQFDQPSAHTTWPSTFSGLSVRAEQ